MSFDRFPEQRAVVTLLRKSLSSGRLAHAYLFSGDDLAEMEAIARTLGKTLNCANPPARGGNGQALDCCDSCLNCRRIDHGNFPDVHWIRPESKLRVITIEQIRDLIQTTSLKPTEGDYKVAVLVAADRMNAQAANAFLKTLEEPPARSVFILLTSAIEQVLETILSRCLRLHFAGEPGIRIDRAGELWLESIARAAGQPSRSLLGRYRLLGLITSRLSEIRAAIEKQLASSSPLNRYPDAEKAQQDKWEAELNAAIEAEYRRHRSELLLLIEWWMRDIWLMTMRVGREMLALPGLAETTAQMASRVSSSEAVENVRQMETLKRRLASNVQETLALEIGLLKLRL